MRGLQADPIDGDLPPKKRDQLGPDVQSLPCNQRGSGKAWRVAELRRARSHPEPGIPGQCQVTAYFERTSGEIADDRFNIALVAVRIDHVGRDDDRGDKQQNQSAGDTEDPSCNSHGADSTATAACCRPCPPPRTSFVQLRQIGTRPATSSRPPRRRITSRSGNLSIDSDNEYFAASAPAGAKHWARGSRSCPIRTGSQLPPA